MVTQLKGEEAHPALRLEEKEGRAMRAIKDAGLDVEWIANYATLGPYDYVDIFRAPDDETALKVSTLVRTISGAYTEVLGAIEWARFREMLAELKQAA